MRDIAVLMPAYNPPETLVAFAKELLHFQKVIIVNDGSNEDKIYIFEELKKLPNVEILTHAINLGKGAALKTGMNYFYLTYNNYVGLVTADADGQHSVENIIGIAKETYDGNKRLILGVRDFAFTRKIPLRSFIGNKITKYVFWALAGMKLEDTQTGLRGIPRSLIPKLLEIHSDGYEFEMEQLLNCRKWSVQVVQMPIQTIYVDNNKFSHFNPLVDSMKIYYLFLRYMFSSLASFFVDFLGFLIVFKMLNNILVSTYIARFFSVWVNYFLNKQFTFHSHLRVTKTLPKYLFLVIIVAFLSAISTESLSNIFNISVIISKIISDTLLYFANFTIQRDFIFGVSDTQDSRYPLE